MLCLCVSGHMVPVPQWWSPSVQRSDSHHTHSQTQGTHSHQSRRELMGFSSPLIHKYSQQISAHENTKQTNLFYLTNDSFTCQFWLDEPCVTSLKTADAHIPIECTELHCCLTTVNSPKYIINIIYCKMILIIHEMFCVFVDQLFVQVTWPYLSEGQAVFVLIFIFNLKVIESFSLRRRLRQRSDALNVTGRQETMTSIQLPVIPVLIHLPSQNDDVTLVELQVARLFALVAVKCFATR